MSQNGATKLYRMGRLREIFIFTGLEVCDLIRLSLISNLPLPRREIASLTRRQFARAFSRPVKSGGRGMSQRERKMMRHPIKDQLPGACLIA